MRSPSVSRVQAPHPVAPRDLPRRLRRRPRPHAPRLAPSSGSLPLRLPQLLPRPRVTPPCPPSRACPSSPRPPLSLLPLPRRRRTLLCPHLPACRKPARPRLLPQAALLRPLLEMPPFLHLRVCHRPPLPLRRLLLQTALLHRFPCPPLRRLNLWPPSTRLLPSSLCPTTCMTATRTSLPMFPLTAMVLPGTSLRPPRPSPQRLRRPLVPQHLRLRPGLPHPSSLLVSAWLPQHLCLPLQLPRSPCLLLRLNRRSRPLLRSLRLPPVLLPRPSPRPRRPLLSLQLRLPARPLVLPPSLRPAGIQPPGSPSSSRPVSASPSR